MPREIHEREDMLRDATALARRVQLRFEPSGALREVFAGFRDAGQLSLYFETDPVYHFNRAGQLRRAFVDDRLLKAEQGRLVALTRQTDSTLLRHNLTDPEQNHFGETMLRWLTELTDALQSKSYVIVGEVSEEGTVVQQLQTWLAEFGSFEIAQSPRVK